MKAIPASIVSKGELVMRKNFLLAWTSFSSKVISKGSHCRYRLGDVECNYF